MPYCNTSYPSWRYSEKLAKPDRYTYIENSSKNRAPGIAAQL